MPIDLDRAAGRLSDRGLIEARVRRLSGRCFAVEATPQGSANAGVIVGDERVMVVDTRVYPRMGEELAALVCEATGVAAGDVVVVNTHFHGDHVFGNCAFPGATILASRLTQDAQRDEWAGQVEVISGFHPDEVPELQRAAQVPATVGFEGSAQVDLGGVLVDLEPVGPAHTPGDIVALVPQERVAFVADIVFNGHWPLVWDANIAGWLRGIEAAQAMLTSETEAVVPGHGAVGGPAMLEEMAACLRFLVELERGDMEQDEAIAASPFADYLHPHRIPHAMQRLRQQKEDALAGAVDTDAGG